MAKDNGMNIFLYQVDAKDLMRVPRPAILHAKDHFIYVKNGEALPKYEFTGFFLSQNGYKSARLVSHAEAKQIVGSKKGGVLRNILPTVLSVVANVIVPGSGAIVGAVSNIGMQQYAKSNHPEQLGKPGNLLDIAGEGFAGGLSGSATQGAISGIKSANAAGAGIMGDIGAGLKGAWQGIQHPIATNPLFGGGQTPASIAGGSAFNIPNTGTVQGGGIASGVNKGLGLNGFVNNANSGFNLKNFSNPSGLSGFFSNPIALGAAQLAGSQIGKPNTSNLDNLGQQTLGDYNTLKTYVGQSPIGQATDQELLNYVHTPLDQLTTQYAQNSEPVIKQINQSFDRHIAETQRAYAGAGQDFRTSSDARDQINKINQDRADAIGRAQSEIQQAALTKAIQSKQYAFAQGLQQNQFDQNLALELANVNGQGKQLQAAIAQNDYQTFQSIIAQILSMGYQNQQHQQDLNYINQLYSQRA